ncbi:MAG TPA: acetyl-coenzyme A synthetase N-terminal domain-containing protein, partial [Nitrososphaeraceae archaeon]|nr:acetyl-coenzyme A synthetase N-terminal domain-containing protein [Nitrososphaeraceae archaeon]
MLDQEDKAIEINLQGKTLQELRTKSLENIEEFWAQQADNLIWSKRWDKTLDWNPPFAKWFTGGL